MSSSVKNRIRRVLEWPLLMRHRKLMQRGAGRTKNAFISKFSGDAALLDVAEKVWRLLVDLSPLPASEFSPSLDDRIGEDFGVVDEDLEDLILQVVEGKNWSENDISSSIEIVTARDLIEFVGALLATQYRDGAQK